MSPQHGKVSSWLFSGVELVASVGAAIAGAAAAGAAAAGAGAGTAGAGTAGAGTAGARTAGAADAEAVGRSKASAGTFLVAKLVASTAAFAASTRSPAFASAWEAG